MYHFRTKYCPPNYKGKNVLFVAQYIQPYMPLEATQAWEKLEARMLEDGGMEEKGQYAPASFPIPASY